MVIDDRCVKKGDLGRVRRGRPSVPLVAVLALGAAILVFPKTTPPTLAEVRAAMGIPSKGTSLRGQRDAVGFAKTAEEMAGVWALSGTPPAPVILGPPPKAPVVGAICPHDDYVYAGRVYRKILPLVTAKHVVVLGVFHPWRRFGTRDVLVFDPYEAWRTPDGPVTVSPLREALLKRLPEGDRIQSAAMHDAEHSVEAIVYWLHHLRPQVEIVPILVSTMNFTRMETLAGDLSAALKAAMEEREWKLGRDVAVVISADAVHYGPDFGYTPFGSGGVEAYAKAVERDEAFLKGPLAGAVTREKVKSFFTTLCDPEHPGNYRVTWCGRFSVPFGLLFLKDLTPVEGIPVAYATSVGWPELRGKGPLPGKTAPDSLYHFVGYPAEAYVEGNVDRGP